MTGTAGLIVGTLVVAALLAALVILAAIVDRLDDIRIAIDEGNEAQPTLRDLFALATMVGYWACDKSCGTHEDAGTFVYESADSTLAARQKGAK